MHLIGEGGNMEEFNFNEAVLEVYIDGYKLAYSILNHQANSQDALHNAVEKAYNHQSTLKDSNKFKQWFLSIVVNEARILLRKNRRLLSLNTEEIEIEQETQSTDISNQIIFKEYLSVLSLDNRILVVMKIVLGYTHSEIATILGKKESTVKTRIYRSLKKLNAYSKEGDESFENQSTTQTI